LGNTFALDAGTHANDCEVMVVATASQSYLEFQAMRVGTAGLITATNPFTWVSTDVLNFAAVVPIIGL
jgi:hypothetical protein